MTVTPNDLSSYGVIDWHLYEYSRIPPSITVSPYISSSLSLRRISLSHPDIPTSLRDQFANDLKTPGLRPLSRVVSATIPSWNRIVTEGQHLHIFVPPTEYFSTYPSFGIVVSSSPNIADADAILFHLTAAVARVSQRYAARVAKRSISRETDKTRVYVVQTLESVTDFIDRSTLGAFVPINVPYKLDEIRMHLANRRSQLASRILQSLKSDMQLTGCHIYIRPNDSSIDWVWLASHQLDASHSLPCNPPTGVNHLVRYDESLMIKNAVASSGKPFPQHALNFDVLTNNELGDPLLSCVPRFPTTSCVIVPIYCHAFDTELYPFAILICYREWLAIIENNVPTIPLPSGPFFESDLTVLNLIAVMLSHALATFRWRDRYFQEADTLNDMARTWLIPKSRTDIFRELLGSLQQQFPMRGYLLAQVDPDRRQVIGQAAYGSFSDGLVEDTVRDLRPQIGYDRESVDVLSKMIRSALDSQTYAFGDEALKRAQKATGIRILDPSDQNDLWQKHIHHETRIRHGIENPLVLVPLYREGSVPRGVILMETLSRGITPDPMQLYQLSIAGQSLAANLEREETSFLAKRDLDVMKRFEDLLTASTSGRWYPENALRGLLDAVCETYGFNQAVLYAVSDSGKSLDGFVGYRVNERHLRKTAYPILPNRTAPNFCRSLALQVYLSAVPAIRDNLSAPPVDESDRSRLDIPGDSAAVVLPLKTAEQVEGVVVLCSRARAGVKGSPTPGFLDRLKGFARFMAALLMLDRHRRSQRRSERTVRAQQSIYRLLGRITEQMNLRTAPETLLRSLAGNSRMGGLRDRFNAIMRDCATIFESPLAGMFLANEPILGTLNDTPGDFDGGRRIYLVAGVGYKDEAFVKSDDGSGNCLSYSVNGRGLTASVVSTLKWQRSASVKDDPAWSRETAKYLEPNIFAFYQDDWSQRCWMGVPIIRRGSEETHVFGALTFSRPRKRLDDGMEFTDDEVQMARDIADAVASTLFSRHQFSVVADGFLRLFRHDGLLHTIISASAGVTESLLDMKESLTTPREVEARSIRRLEVSEAQLYVAEACIDTYRWDAERGRDAQGWRSEPVRDWDEVLRKVIVSSKAKLSAAECRIEIVGESLRFQERNVQIWTDEYKMVFMLDALISNSIVAVQSRGVDDTTISVCISLSGSHTAEGDGGRRSEILTCLVQDSGVGFDNTESLNNLGRCRRVGVFGVGLTMVRKLVEACRLDDTMSCGQYDSKAKEGGGTEVWFEVPCYVQEMTGANEHV